MGLANIPLVFTISRYHQKPDSTSADVSSEEPSSQALRG